MRSPFSALPRDDPPVDGPFRLRRYATIARSSSSGAVLDGMSVFGTPLRIVWNTRSSVVPADHNRVRS